MVKMLNVVVKKDFPFPDRYTGIKYKAGTKLKITEARLAEIKRSGDYVEVLKPSAAPVKNDKVEKPTNDIKK